MDMLTPGEMFDAWRSDTQAGFSLVRSQLEISETSLRKEILGVHKRLDTLELGVSSIGVEVHAFRREVRSCRRQV